MATRRGKPFNHGASTLAVADGPINIRHAVVDSLLQRVLHRELNHRRETTVDAHPDASDVTGA